MVPTTVVIITHAFSTCICYRKAVNGHVDYNG